MSVKFWCISSTWRTISSQKLWRLTGTPPMIGCKPMISWFPLYFFINQSIDWLGTQHLPMISPEGRHAMRGWRHAPCAVGAMRHAPGVPGTACLWFFVNPITEDVPTLGPIYIYKWHIIWWYIYIIIICIYIYIYIYYLLTSGTAGSSFAIWKLTYF